MLSQLKQLDLEGADLDEMISLLSHGKMVVQQYNNMHMEPPEWLTTKVEKLESVAESKRKENLQRALRDAKARRASLATAEEKRSREDESIARLERELGIGSQPTS